MPPDADYSTWAIQLTDDYNDTWLFSEGLLGPPFTFTADEAEHVAERINKNPSHRVTAVAVPHPTSKGE